ncbi:MAG: Cache 3/Cache 2 fusion domain-containing protein [Bacteroidales bacterium]
MPPKFRLFLPILLGIVISISLITLYSVQKLKNNLYFSLERNLAGQVQSIEKMFERERDLRLDKVKTDLKVARRLFYDAQLEILNREVLLEIRNQSSGVTFETKLNWWMHDGRELLTDHTFVDDVKALVGGTATVFQKSDSGYVRISTNVLTSDSLRAVRTFIPNDSPVVQAVERGEVYIGRAFVVNAWYITAYEPILKDDAVVGMLYVGDKEKDLPELRKKITALQIGKSGFPFVMDESGTFIIHPFAGGENWSDEPAIRQMLKKKTGTGKYRLTRDKIQKLVYWEYFEDFRLIIAASVPLREETGAMVQKIIVNAVIIGLVIILALSSLIFFITTENVRKFLTQLEVSSRQLKKTEQALEQSERHFQTLFNNSSDDIFVIDFEGNFIEVNQMACDNLGYKHEEFLRMNAREIKPDALKNEVAKNISLILKFGQHRYESENQARDGRIIPVEMKSRVIDFRGEKAILTIARDISERKEIEDRILSTIIRTEENERKRFAADLHDDLAPILSTVKLYTDLLKKKNYRKINEEEAIQNIEELLDMAIQSTRTISRNIRPNILQDFGLAAAVNDFCAFINKTESISLEVNTSQYKIEQRGIEESILYQAVKELINNTLKHASARNVKIELKSFDNQIILYYRDDGDGFDLQAAMKQNTGLGLNNIINKIRSVKGTVDINTRPGTGMFLVASIRLKPVSPVNQEQQ